MATLYSDKLTLRGFVLALVVCLCARPTLNVAKTEDAVTHKPASLSESLFLYANELNRSLHDQPLDKRSLSQYRHALDSYNQIVRLNTDTHYSAESLARMAELLREMADASGDSALYQEAIETYRRILSEHPGSSFVGDSLVNIALVYEENLQDLDGAAAAYKELIEHFPSSVMAREARAVLVRFERQLRNRAPDVLARDGRDLAAGPEPGGPRLTNIRNFTGTDYARIVIDLSDPVSFSGSKVGPNRLVVKLSDSAVSRSLAGRRFIVGESGLLKRITVLADAAPTGLPAPGETTVSLEVASLTSYSLFQLSDPERIVIDLHHERPSSASAGVASQRDPSPREPSAGSWRNQKALLSLPEIGEPILPLPPSDHRAAGDPLSRLATGNAPNEPSEPRSEAPVRRIVIDPGHGGHDTGTISSSGLREKDLVLDVARRLRAYIKHRFPEVEVILTRDSDRFVALEERTAIANSRQADLFISIHANASESRIASGVETFFLSPDRASGEDLKAAERENARTAGDSNARKAQPVYASISAGNRVSESRELARYIQSGLVRGVGASAPNSATNRGVKHAPFVVLLGAAMPSVLAEVSFLSNPRDDSLLQTSQFRERIAASLFAGLNAYLKKKASPETRAR
jgi:N-acetylmuramoyl-L-alanine amidase